MKSETQILLILKKIFTEKYRIPSELWKNENLSRPLTGSVWKLSGIDLSFILFEIEKEFEIKFKEDDLINYGFSSISKIVNLLMKKINN